MKKKHSMTLIEIMIVMALIVLIAGAISLNMRGTLEEGKAFKTHQNIQKVKEAVFLEAGQNAEAWDNLESDSDYWKLLIQRSNIVKRPKDLVKDGWGTEFEVKIDANEQIIRVTSKKFTSYRTQHPGKFPADDEE